jgi:hypothetical protein
MDGISTASSVIAIVTLCKSITKFVTKVIGEMSSEENIKELRADIHSLSEEVELVGEKCDQAQEPSSNFQIPHRMLERINTRKCACHKTLNELKKLLEQANEGYFSTGPLKRLKSAILTTLRSERVEKLQQEVTKHQQSLHFYVTLISE